VDLIGAILAGIVGVLAAAFSKQAADEFKAWTPRLIAAVVQCAVRRLHEDQRDRYAEEWRSHIDETPGEIGKLVVGLGLLWAAWKLSRTLPKPRARQIEEIVTAIRAAERWRRQKYIVRLVTLRAASKRLRFLQEVLQDQQTQIEMMRAVLRIAAEEPGDPFMQKWAAVWEEGFEKGYRASAAGRNAQPSDLASAIANARARRRGVANRIKEGLD
jgi:hypothetical protein